jgi:hypothetical protein
MREKWQEVLINRDEEYFFFDGTMQYLYINFSTFLLLFIKDYYFFNFFGYNNTSFSHFIK